MGVYIREMEMPDCCITCRLECLYRAHSSTSRSKYCPLVEVKAPHGRLGDLDYAVKLLREYVEEYSEVDENGLHSEKWCGYMECIGALKEIPTVIEAEV